MNRREIIHNAVLLQVPESSRLLRLVTVAKYFKFALRSSEKWALNAMTFNYSLRKQKSSRVYSSAFPCRNELSRAEPTSFSAQNFSLDRI